jgi:hypothetical protein
MEWSTAGREVPAGVRRGVRRLGGGGARGSKATEREKQEKERSGLGTIPAYVRRADTSADDHKQVGLHGDRGALCSSATRRT